MKDDRLYVGMTSDLNRRKTEHGVKSSTRTTKIFGAKEIPYSEKFSDRNSASRRERQLKGWSHAKKEAFIKGDIESLRRLAKSRNRADLP